MHLRHGGAHPAVAFIFNQAQRSGFRHRKIDTAQSDIGLIELLAQRFAGDGGKFSDIFGIGCSGNIFMKDIRNLLLIFVNGGDNDMGRCFVVQLNDKFAQVCFKGLDTVFL